MPHKDKAEKAKYNKDWLAKHPNYKKDWLAKHLNYKKNYRESHKNHCVYCIETSDHRMYVGSTDFLDQRICRHKNTSNIYPDWKIYQAIKETGGWESTKVHVLMKDIPCKELRLKLEHHFIDLVPKQLNLNTLK